MMQKKIEWNKKLLQEQHKKIDQFALQKRSKAKFYRLIKANSLA